MMALDRQGIYSIGINNRNQIFCGTHYGRIYSTTNFGNSWLISELNIPEYVTSLTFNANGHIFAGTGNGLWDSGYDGKGIYKSTDNGNYWYNINNGLTYLDITTVLSNYEILTNQAEIIFAGSMNGGFYRTTNNGNYWEKLNEGLFDLNVQTMALDVDGYIYVGTQGASIFKSSQTTTNLNEILSNNNFIIEQNYPNPFNPSTKIKYSMTSLEFVTLKVYDVLGNEVATLVNKEKPAGSYEVEFDGTGLASGIYFYQIRAGDFVETKKMVLIK